ncbi:hypothetical protein HNQ77_004879 [Silvibacterium bohemicum]|uniref:Uncharacterized protein n=1 Tax=Silvibacterium bohemicum TaxID=1577686 RepID=A0A841K8K8_9BACT|nr:hypothetical protein [Silvibacterium bohemicum]MBB6146898.1 hypothetical protein [Silvibacterium bohemicum]
MNEPINRGQSHGLGQSKGETALSPAGAGRLPLPSATTPPHATEESRLKELEAANARLLKLVGELLVVNQQLRERSAS